jgi:DNA topoisomerase-2
LRSPDAASPRYLYVRHSKYTDIWKSDYDLLEFEEEEGQKVEPKYYLPIIPVVLTASQVGMAPGYKFSCISYNPIDVIDAQIEYLKESKIKTQLRPYVNGVRPESFTYSETSGRWSSHGTYTLNEKTSTVQITDFPYDITFKTIDETFNKLLDTGKVKDWKNFSHEGKMDYRVMFEQKDFNRLKSSPAELEKMLLLVSVVPQNIFNIINEKNKLQYFDDEYALLKHFCDWRLTIYEQRKTKLISVMEERYKKNNEICEFISLVNSGKIKIQNRKKADIKEDLKKFNLSADVLQTEISKLTDEEKTLLIKKNEELQKELEYVRNTTTLDMFLKDLKDIKKKIKADFEN